MTAVLGRPPVWRVPREWPGARCFVLCGGASLKQQRHLVPQLQGRIIAVKESVVLRPDADVWFVSGEESDKYMRPLWSRFRGTYIIVRNKWKPGTPDHAKLVARTKEHGQLCDDPKAVAGYDAGTSAINVAYHFGATEIILLGYDMVGGRWFTGELQHDMPFPPESHFQRHMAPLPALAADARAKGIRIVNCSPISRVTCFERQPLEAFL